MNWVALQVYWSEAEMEAAGVLTNMRATLNNSGINYGPEISTSVRMEYPESVHPVFEPVYFPSVRPSAIQISSRAPNELATRRTFPRPAASHSATINCTPARIEYQPAITFPQSGLYQTSAHSLDAQTSPVDTSRHGIILPGSYEDVVALHQSFSSLREAKTAMKTLDQELDLLPRTRFFPRSSFTSA